MGLSLVHNVAAGAFSWRVAIYNAASLVQAGRYDDLLSALAKFDIVAVLGSRVRSDLQTSLSR